MWSFNKKEETKITDYNTVTSQINNSNISQKNTDQKNKK